MKKLASLEIWNQEFYVAAVMSFLDSLVSNHADLIISRYHAFRFVASEILRIRIESAYPGSKGKLYVEFFLTDTYFEVSIRDKGVPGWQDFSYHPDRLASSRQDFRNFALDQILDGIGIEKLGKEGQRLFIRMNIINPIHFKPPKPYPEMTVLDKKISIRPVTTEEDAIEAIRCIYSEYGYSYAYERLYYIDSFLRLIRSGELMSFLAVNDHGQTAGHFALAFSDLYQNMPELSTVVIRKEFRGLGLFSKFIEHSIEIGKQHHIRAMMGQPVAFHPMSQKAFLRGGFTATSLLMSYLGADTESVYNQKNQRLDLTASVRIMDPAAASRICPPTELLPFIQKIYNKLGWPYDLLDSTAPGEHSTVCVEDNVPLKMTKIILREAAEDISQILKDSIRDAIRKKNEMIELVILLNSPSCDFGYRAAKECGFAVSGVIPGAENGDYLIMQLLIGDVPDYDKLVMVGEFEELRNDIVMLNHLEEGAKPL